MYEHRGTFHTLGYSHSGGVKPAFAPALEGEGAQRHVVSWDNFDRLFGPLLDGSAFAGTRRGPRPIEGMYTPINPEWPARYHLWGTPEYDAEFTNVVGEMEKHFKEKGWTRTAFEMFFNHKKRYRGFGWDGDEARFTGDDRYFEKFGALLKASVPEGSPVHFRYRVDSSWRMRGQVDILAGIADQWCLAFGISTMFPDIPPLVRARGETVWLYCSPCRIYDPSSQVMTQPMTAFLFGAQGYSAWLTVGSRRDVPAKNDACRTQVAYSGESFGIDGPIPSIRLKLERNVLQDLAILGAAAPFGEAEGLSLRTKIGALFGFADPAELWSSNSKLKAIDPWKWSNPDMTPPNIGPGLFGRGPGTAAIWLGLRQLTLDAYADRKLALTGVEDFTVVPAAHPLDGYVAPAAPAVPVVDRKAFIAALQRVGAICTQRLTAEECAKVVPDEIPALLLVKDPRDEWAGSDNYNVDLDRFDAVKRELRLIAEREAGFPVDCNLWLVLTREPLRVHPVIRQVHGYSLFYDFGQMYLEKIPADLLPVLTEARRVVVDKGEKACALEPLVAKDGTVVGFIEVVTAANDYATGMAKKK
jgi:hypothetical protein